MDNCRDDECLALLQKALDDENVDPINLTYSVFKIITKEFSGDQLIGQGGFGAVYKGKLKNGTVVAVKKLDNKIDKIEILEKNFQSEIDCLKNVKHENIVRFLGYCAETEPVVTWYPNEGRKVQAEVWHRLFCLEYVSKGNLSEYISEPSSGLKWRERYQIIKGICEGVGYLHSQNIVHMDLKPQNILLGDGMVPKIADFGLSKRFTEDQSRTITGNKAGSLGYMAPEFIDSGTITLKVDIYSLGVIIIEILTGCRRECLSIDMVLESWLSTFETWGNRRSLLAEQVKLCGTIGMACMDKDPSNRPAIQFIISCLNKMDISNSSSTSSVPSTSCREVCKGVQLDMFCHHYDQARQACKPMRICGSKLSHSGLSESDSLYVYPLELRFPFFQQERKRTRCSLNFTNRTDRYVGYWIFPEFPSMYTRIGDPIPILDPFCTAIVCVEMEKQEQPPPPHTDMFLVMMICKENKMDLQGLISSNEATTQASLLRHVEELGGEVHAAMVVVYPPGDGEGLTCQLSSSSLRGKKGKGGGGGGGPPAASGAPMMGGMAMPPPPQQQQQQPVPGMMMRPPNMMGSGGFPGGMGQAMGQMGGTPMGHHHTHHQHMGGGGNGMQMQLGGGGAVHGVPAGGMPRPAGFYQGGGAVAGGGGMLSGKNAHNGGGKKDSGAKHNQGGGGGRKNGGGSQAPKNGKGGGNGNQQGQQSKKGGGGGSGPPAGADAPMMGGMAMPPPPQHQQQQPGPGMVMRPPSMMGGAGFPGGMGQAMGQMGGTPMGHQHMGGGGNGMQMQPGGAGAVLGMPAGGGMPGAPRFYQGGGGMPSGPPQMMQAAGNPMAMAQAQQQQMNGHGGGYGYEYGRPAMQYPQLPPYYYHPMPQRHPIDNMFSDENPNSCTVM